MTSRKFWTMILAQAVWIGLLLTDNMSEPGFLSLTNLTIGGYFIANVVQKGVERVKMR